MVETDLAVLSSVLVPFIDSQQVDHASRYHSFEFVSDNYKLEDKMTSEPKLSETMLIIGCYLVDRQHKMVTGVGKHG